MRFLLIAVHVCKGIVRGVKGEVTKLREQTRINELIKHKNEEMNEEFKRLGEYVYYHSLTVDDEHVDLLKQTIRQLQEEIEQCEQEIRGE